MAFNNKTLDVEATATTLVDSDAVLCVDERGEEENDDTEGTTFIDKLESENNVDSDGSGIYTQNSDGDTKLHESIIDLDSQNAIAYIEKASSPEQLDIRNNIFQTPLHLAVLTGQTDVAKQLVRAGVSLSARDKNGDSALNVASRKGNADIVAVIIEGSKRLDDEIDASVAGIRNPLNWNLANYEGLTCIHLAAMNGHNNVLEMLVNAGADINVRESKAGRSVLHTACLNGNVELVSLLVEMKSCDTNARSYDGFTPFELARTRRHEDICILLANTINVDASTDKLANENDNLYS